MLDQRLNTKAAKGTAALLLAAAALVMNGCSNGLSGDSYRGGPAAGSSVHLTGSVFGGQQPVSGSTIQLYTVGTTGMKSAARPMIGATVQSDAYGNFSITGDYQCNDGVNPVATQVYITATGGNPGIGSNNSTISMVAALGACSSLSASTFVNINEMSTIAFAYALSPFTTDITHVGATGTNPTGLVNAFANATALEDTASGIAGSTTLPAGVSVPVTEMNTLADILALCVNSTGTGNADCTALFSASGGSDTFSAALGIARNPAASAVTALYSRPNANSPFQPTLPSRPADFTLALTSTGNGNFATPFGIAVDAAGNAWVTNETGTNLVQLTPTGALAANITSLGLTGAQAVALDRSGNVWVANTAGNSVVKATVSGGTVSSSSSFTAGGIDAPVALALDWPGNAWIANFNGNSVTALTSTGSALGGSPFTGNGNITLPAGIAVSPTGTVYVTSGNGSAVVLGSAGAYSSTVTDNALQGPTAVAIDPSSHVVLTGFTTGASSSGAVSEFAAGGAAAAVSPVSNASMTPAAVAADGTSLWVTNASASGGLVQMTYGSSAIVSPAAGYGSLNMPQGVAVDGSGSVWTANAGSNTVSKFVGLAAPVTTPLVVNLQP
jgi:hypothetical protein